MPIEHLAGLGDGRHQFGGIARPPRRHAVRHGFSRYAARRIEHVLDAGTMTGAEVHRIRRATIHQIERARNMRGGEIVDVNVIAHTCAVGCRVIAAEHVERIDVARRRHQGARNEMRLGVVALARLAIGIAATGIEITQRHEADAVSHVKVTAQLLHHQFGVAIRIDRPLRRLLGDRHAVGLAIGGAGR